MTIIEITSRYNGSHDNNTISDYTPESFSVPDGWAVIPEELGTPDTLENYPFGEITVETIEGVPTVTSWTPLPMPEPDPPPEPAPSLEERVGALETETAAISAAIERGLVLQFCKRK